MSGRVQISQLGSRGRWGNQLFQYAFARGYAERLGAVLEVPGDWVGRELLEVGEGPIRGVLPEYSGAEEKRDVDLVGFFQAPWCLRTYSREKARRWLRIKPELVRAYRCNRGVVAHLRRGDFVKEDMPVVKIGSYLRCLGELGIGFEEVFWVEEGGHRGPSWRTGFLGDFLMMMKAEVLLRANSSFSWWAATLGEAQVYSPKVGVGDTGWVDATFVNDNGSRIGNFPFECRL